MKRLWKFGLEKPLSVQSFMGCSVEAWKRKIFRDMQMVEGCVRGKQNLMRLCAVFCAKNV